MHKSTTRQWATRFVMAMSAEKSPRRFVGSGGLAVLTCTAYRGWRRLQGTLDEDSVAGSNEGTAGIGVVCVVRVGIATLVIQQVRLVAS